MKFEPFTTSLDDVDTMMCFPAYSDDRKNIGLAFFRSADLYHIAPAMVLGFHNVYLNNGKTFLVASDVIKNWLDIA